MCPGLARPYVCQLAHVSRVARTPPPNVPQSRVPIGLSGFYPRTRRDGFSLQGRRTGGQTLTGLRRLLAPEAGAELGQFRQHSRGACQKSARSPKLHIRSHWRHPYHVRGTLRSRRAPFAAPNRRASLRRGPRSDAGASRWRWPPRAAQTRGRQCCCLQLTSSPRARAGGAEAVPGGADSLRLSRFQDGVATRNPDAVVCHHAAPTRHTGPAAGVRAARTGSPCW